MAIDFGPAGRRFNRAYAYAATRPIRARLVRHSRSGKALLIDTGVRAAWVPKRLVTHDPATGVFTMPHWLSVEKMLD